MGRWCKDNMEWESAGVRRDGVRGAGGDGGGAGAGDAGLLRSGGAGGDEHGGCRVSGMVTVGRGGECPGGMLL